MRPIAHRCNTCLELKNTPREWGVEVDIRSYGQRLIVHHEPFVDGENFEDWLAAYHHGTLVLNVKEEGLEARLIEMMKSKGLEDYFFLDQSFPFLVKWALVGEKRLAVRVSEFESIETALNLAGKIDWVWVDCFTRFSLTKQDADRLQQAGFKLCLVSPELQGHNAEAEIPKLVKLLRQQGIKAQAFCTKYPELWQKAIDCP